MSIIKNFDVHTEQTNLALDTVRLFLVFSLSFFSLTTKGRTFAMPRLLCSSAERGKHLMLQSRVDLSHTEQEKEEMERVKVPTTTNSSIASSRSKKDER